MVSYTVSAAVQCSSWPEPSRNRSFFTSRYQSQNSCHTKSQSVLRGFVVSMLLECSIDGFVARFKRPKIQASSI